MYRLNLCNGGSANPFSYEIWQEKLGNSASTEGQQWGTNFMSRATEGLGLLGTVRESEGDGQDMLPTATVLT